MWEIDIVEHGDRGGVIKTLGPYATQRVADRVDDGLQVNLDHDHFYTVIRRVEQNENEP